MFGLLRIPSHQLAVASKKVGESTDILYLAEGKSQLVPGLHAPHRRMKRLHQGSAPLEFVLCLPILLTLFLAILWLGFAFITQANVSIEARNLAWKRREISIDGEGPAKSKDWLCFEQDGFVSGEVTRAVEMGPLFVSFRQPSYKHTIIGDSWADTSRNKQLSRDRHLDSPLSTKVYLAAGKTLIKGYGGPLHDFATWFQPSKIDDLKKGKIDRDLIQQMALESLVDYMAQSNGWNLQAAMKQWKAARKNYENFRNKVVSVRKNLEKLRKTLKKSSGGVNVPTPGLDESITALKDIEGQFKELEKMLDNVETYLPGGKNEIIPSSIIPADQR